ncbi:WSC domain-containing protein [Lachnellula suecica]|uniref:WSC domain-containing protein n=1 Tax=Lachnellula suecica TaxID=602035 RepID=A0A8T9BUS0_9HELO|nr:WSC domain-containing protein [Lachnellula suecica]
MHFSKPTIMAALASSAYAGTTQRTFAVNHFYGQGPLTMGRMDPIVSPGGPSGHVHAIQGGNGFALDMQNLQALDSSCTSSLVKADRSNYWTPALYFQDQTTQKFEAVEMFYMNVYYFMEPTEDQITPFPPGLRLIIGDPSLRTPPATGGIQITDLGDGAIQPVQWVCPRSNTNSPLYPTDSDGLHGVGIQDPTNAGSGVGFPDQNCDGYASPLRADVTFPSCWNNATDPSMVDPVQNPEGYKYLDTFTNKAAVTWPTKGNCPAGWAHLPKLFYEVYWNTPKFASRWTPGQQKQPFVLANGDPTGYSLHGDFVAGWDTKVLQTVIDTCNAGDDGMDKCPNIGDLNDDSTSCNIANLVPENIGATVGTVLDALPGNNPVGAWGVAAGAAVAPTGATVAPTAVDSGSAPGASSAAGGQTEVASSVAAPTTTSAPASAPASNPAEPVVGDDSSTQTTLATVTQAATSSAASATSTSTGSGSTVADGWSYTGCYADTTARVLSGITLANVGQHAVTNTKCVSYCAARGFSMAGTEYGGQCFCGNSMSTVTKLDDSKCAMPCEGDASQTCGGGMALSVYSQAAPKFRRALGRLRRYVE